MAIVNAELPTLLDVAKRTDPNGGISALIEMLTRRNVFLQDMVWKEGNLPTGHRFTSRTGLPAVSWRKFNEGVAPGKSRTSQMDETCGMLEGISKVDRDLARLNGNAAAFRASEDKAFLQSMNNEVESAIVYASASTSPEKIHGLIPRLDATTSTAGSQVLLAEADDTGSDYGSILLIGWGPDSVYGIYPRGSQQGMETIDMGLQLINDGQAAERQFVGYVTNFKWHLGLAVQDWRYIVRIANIDTGALAGTDDTIIPLMIEAAHQLESREGVRPVFYVNRQVNTFLHLQARNATKNSTLSTDMIDGRPITSLMGIPIRMTDALTSTEDGIA